jgi:hypothetical protein
MIMTTPDAPQKNCEIISLASELLVENAWNTMPMASIAIAATIHPTIDRV